MCYVLLRNQKQTQGCQNRNPLLRKSLKPGNPRLKMYKISKQKNSKKTGKRSIIGIRCTEAKKGWQKSMSKSIANNQKPEGQTNQKEKEILRSQEQRGVSGITKYAGVLGTRL